MTKICRIILLIGFLISYKMISGQITSKTDSLKKLLLTAREDTMKIDILNDLSYELWQTGDYDTALYCANQAKGIITKLISVNNSEKRDILFLEKRMASSLSYIGLISYNQGNYHEALKNHFAALKIKEEIGDQRSIANTYLSIGNVYWSQDNNSEALKMYLNCLKIREEIEKKNPDDIRNKKDIAASHNNIGIFYKNEDNYADAFKNYFLALKIRKEVMAKYPSDISNKRGIANTYLNIGGVYLDQGDYAEALKNCLIALKINEEIGNKQALARTCSSIGSIYTRQKKMTLAMQYFSKGLMLAKEIGSKEDLRFIYEGMAKTDSAQGNYKQAYLHYQMYISYRDSLVNEENTKKTVQIQMQYEYGKKEALIQAEHEKQSALSTAENRKQKIITWSVVAGLLLVILFAGFILRSLRITQFQKQVIELKKKEVDKKNTIIEKQKELVEEKNKHITDSIHYAKRIQTALITSDGYLKQNLPEHFVLYKPKDIVSGDFYWGNSVNGKFLFTIADCTGHGVPGAFMSVLGVSLLNEITNEEKITRPDLILNRVREGIIKSLNHEEENIIETELQDGMDCVLCSFDFKNSIIEFSCANNPLWLIRNGELIKYKPDLMPVGMCMGENKPFTLHKFQLLKGDAIYTFSDGYVDQMGSKTGKKFRYKQLEEVILSIHDKPMEKQKNILDEKFESWKGDLWQVDDVLICGIKI